MLVLFYSFFIPPTRIGKVMAMSNQGKQASFQVTGMTCAACAARIEKGLNRMDGVQEANVNLALEKSVVQYDPERITELELEKKIQDLGYDVVKEKKEF